MSGIFNNFPSSQTDVFICCSDEDKRYVKTLKKYFRASKLHIWDETMVSPGLITLHEIKQALQSAKVVILLSSVDLFNNENFIKYIQVQVTNAALQKKITLIHVILRPCVLENEDLAKFQSINLPSQPLVKMNLSEQEEIWIKVAKLVNETTKMDDPTFEYLLDQSEMLEKATNYFLRCRYMKTKELRKQILLRLPGNLIQEIDAFPITSQDNCNEDFEEVFNLVNICSSDPNGLEKLAYALYQSEHASLSWQQLDRYLRKSGEKLVTYTRLQELYNILKPVQWLDHLLGRAYRDSVPENWETLHNYDVPDKLRLVIEDLVKIPFQNDNTFPILEFVQRLAYFARDRPDKPLHDSLRKWIMDRLNDLGLTESQQIALREKAKKRRPYAAFYLLLTLDSASEVTFYTQAWLFDDENCIINNVNLDLPDVPCLLSDVPGLLEDLLKRCEDCLQDEMENLIVEFFLPLELLSYPVDQYAIAGLKTSQSISLYHQVVVRSLDRVQNWKKSHTWKNKWKLFIDCKHDEQLLNQNKNMMFVCHEEYYNGPEAFSAMLQGSSIACLALTFVPSNSPFQNDDILLAILEAGVPIALWPREQSNYPKALHQLLTELVSQHSVFQLPDLVKQQRYEALTSGNKQQHQGHHLTLLWDDPNRLPPSIMTTRQLVMPSTGRGA